MLTNLRLPSIGLMAVLAQISSSFAQNNSTNNTSECGKSQSYRNLLSEYATVNSTGRTPISWDIRTPTVNPDNQDPWYMSVIVNDTSRKENTSDVIRMSFLSIPNDVGDAGVCIYRLSSINATATGTGLNGCEGVISETCMDYIRQIVLAGANSKRCASPLPGVMSKDKRKEECDHLIRESGYTTTPFNASNQTCTFEKVPGVTLPDNYHSVQSPGVDDPFESFSGTGKLPSYDLNVRQTVPHIITASFGANGGTISDAKVVCVRPDNVVDGSRVPPLKEPWKSSGVGSNWKGSGFPAILFAGIVGLLLGL